MKKKIKVLPKRAVAGRLRMLSTEVTVIMTRLKTVRRGSLDVCICMIFGVRNSKKRLYGGKEGLQGETPGFSYALLLTSLRCFF